MERHYRRRYYRYKRRDRWYFEEIARRVISEGRATVDLGVVAFDVTLEQSDLRGQGLLVVFWAPDGVAAEGQSYYEWHSEEQRISMIVEYTIMQAAQYKGGHIPRPELETG